MLHVCHTTKGPSKGHKCWKAFTALLMQEVLQSGDLPASLVSDKQGKKRVMGAVNMTVGQTLNTGISCSSRLAPSPINTEAP